MMRIPYLVALILMLSATVEGDSSVEFTVSPVVQRNFGYTEYILQAGYHEEVEGVDEPVFVRVKSKLEFPLDATLVGLELGVQSRLRNRKAWSVRAGLYINVDDPDKLMKDHDWVSVPSLEIYDTKFSYTESRSELEHASAMFEFTKQVWGKGVAEVSFLAGFAYHRITQDIIGYDGWQLDAQAEAHHVSDTVKALYYRITYSLPQIGLVGNVTTCSRSSVELKMALSRVFASDYDDHLLRGKYTKASPTGWGFLARFRGRLFLSGLSEQGPFVALQAEYISLGASGKQTQTWYKDERYWNEATGDWEIVPKGTVVRGIAYQVNSTQYRVGLFLGILF